MRQTFIVYNNAQLNALLKAKKLGYISVVNARYYTHRDTKEFMFNVVTVEGSKVAMRVMEKLIELFSPRKVVSCMTNNKFEITEVKDL